MKMMCSSSQYVRHPPPGWKLHDLSPPNISKKAQAFHRMLVPLSFSTVFFSIHQKTSVNAEEWCRDFYFRYRISAYIDPIRTDTHKINNLFQIPVQICPRCRSPTFLRFDSTENKNSKRRKNKWITTIR